MTSTRCGTGVRFWRNMLIFYFILGLGGLWQLKKDSCEKWYGYMGTLYYLFNFNVIPKIKFFKISKKKSWKILNFGLKKHFKTL